MVADETDCAELPAGNVFAVCGVVLVASAKWAPAAWLGS